MVKSAEISAEWNDLVSWKGIVEKNRNSIQYVKEILGDQGLLAF
jgi:hypothetical protein